MQFFSVIMTKNGEKNMNEKMMRKYANMLARVGINVQPGQKVLVEACVEGYEFANLFAEEAY
ncbi:MAG: aminopeptidase, partial [Erysipelotrichaceae bacterium]|nr:aminopeptidase [Erysipelotrichaceae bacterium]